MTRNLIRLWHLDRTGAGWSHVRSFDHEGGRGESGVLGLWGLMAERANEKEDRRTSGFWRLTELGRRFVELRESVPIYVLVGPKSRLLGYAGPLSDVRQCLERLNRFSYRELMGEEFGRGVQLALDLRTGLPGLDARRERPAPSLGASP